jgi:hypothetical protein
VLLAPLLGDPVREGKMEEAYRLALQGRPVEVLRASEVLPAGLGEEAFFDLMAKNGVDGVLVLRLAAAGTMPGAVGDYHAGKDVETHPNSCDAKIPKWTYDKPGEGLHEEDLSMPWLDMTVALVDPATREPAWSVRTRTQGTQGTPFGRLARTQADEVVKRLARDGMLAPAR